MLIDFEKLYLMPDLLHWYFDKLRESDRKLFKTLYEETDSYGISLLALKVYRLYEVDFDKAKRVSLRKWESYSKWLLNRASLLPPSLVVKKRKQAKYYTKPWIIEKELIFQGFLHTKLDGSTTEVYVKRLSKGIKNGLGLKGSYFISRFNGRFYLYPKSYCNNYSNLKKGYKLIHNSDHGFPGFSGIWVPENLN